MVAQYMTQWSTGTTRTVAVTSAVPAQSVAYLSVLHDNSTGGTVTGVSGLGGTWEQDYNQAYFKVWRGVGCTGTGNVTVTLTGANVTLGLWFVPDTTADVISVSQVSTTGLGTTTGPSQLAGLGQIVLNHALTYASATGYPVSPAPATGWTSMMHGPYAGVAYRVPATEIGVTEVHQLSATAPAGGNHNAIGQIVVGSLTEPTGGVFLGDTEVSVFLGVTPVDFHYGGD